MPVPDHQLPRILTRPDAVALGFTRAAIEHRLRTRRWRAVLPQVYLTRDTMVWTDRLAAGVAYAGTDAVLTGSAALADLGLRCVTRPQQLLVLAPRGATATSRSFVRVRRTHRLPAAVRIPGPPRAHPARAVADVALELRRLDDVRTLVAQAVRARLCSLDDLATELTEGPRRGSAHLRQAIAEVGDGAWSAPEARAAALLRRGGVPAFEQNARIDLPGGSYRIVDFLWRDLRAVLEIDSAEHHLDPADWRSTMDRHLTLETLGYSVIHRPPAAVYTAPGRFVRDVDAWLTARRSALRS